MTTTIEMRELSCFEIEAIGGGGRGEIIKKGLKKLGDWLGGGTAGLLVEEAIDALNKGPKPQFRDSQMLNNPRPGVF